MSDMIEYVVTIRNGGYPLTYRAKTITDAFMCLIEASYNGHLLHTDLFEPDELMGILVHMKEEKSLDFESGMGYKIERVVTEGQEGA
ncbi:MAG: hypothetical protein IJT94_07130 [Oscillibacter sp.]|nr:hypothetical protein [Oscillibacter sp.]